MFARTTDVQLSWSSRMRYSDAVAVGNPPNIGSVPQNSGLRQITGTASESKIDGGNFIPSFNFVFGQRHGVVFNINLDTTATVLTAAERDRGILFVSDDRTHASLAHIASM